MKKVMTFANAAMIGVALLSSPAGAQGTSQTVDLAKVDVQTLSAGYRASKVVGSSVSSEWSLLTERRIPIWQDSYFSGGETGMGLPRSNDGKARFLDDVEGLTSVIGHADRAKPLRDYCLGLMMPCERKSVEPMAAITAPERTAASISRCCTLSAREDGRTRRFW